MESPEREQIQQRLRDLRQEDAGLYRPTARQADFGIWDPTERLNAITREINQLQAQ